MKKSMIFQRLIAVLIILIVVFGCSVVFISKSDKVNVDIEKNIKVDSVMVNNRAKNVNKKLN